jgi:hypothetical protein|tara:strand:+ start:367 stop:561 length:195 start_codon:yes stop_codon:yes gene_type:complete
MESVKTGQKKNKAPWRSFEKKPINCGQITRYIRKDWTITAQPAWNGSFLAFNNALLLYEPILIA